MAAKVLDAAETSLDFKVLTSCCSIKGLWLTCMETSVASLGLFFSYHRRLMLLAMTLVPANVSGSLAATPPAPQYLQFEIFLGGPNPATGVFHRDKSKDDMLRTARKIADTIRPPRTSSERNLGMTVGPIAMDLGADGARSAIRDAFDVALEADTAIALHLDDYMFWAQARLPDGRLLRDIQGTAEWKDWSGTPAGGLEIGWLPNVKLAPQICYENAAVKDFTTWWTRDIVGREIKTQFDRLVQAGKSKLFAGVIVGWESNMAYGYCSLSQLGYSRQNEPADFDHEREHILQRHIEAWAKGIHDAGIPADAIFTHLGPISKQEYEKINAMLPRARIREIPQSTAFRAFGAAFNRYSNPGFSVYPAEGLFDDIYQAMRDFGHGTWAMAEGTNVVLSQGGPSRSPFSWETYLARSFNHGARIANIFGGFQGEGAGPFRQATESEQAVSAYRKFLQGDHLVEDAGK
jgi:hypothetical protein